MPSPGVSLDVLRRVAAFGELGDADLAALGACVRARRYAAGDMIFHEGDPGATMLLVAEGTLVADVTHRLRLLDERIEFELVKMPRSAPGRGA
jgi:hypothetical protein